ncbi:hypothetical protein Tco_0776437 [Tanacetum coccineum]
MSIGFLMRVVAEIKQNKVILCVVWGHAIIQPVSKAVDTTVEDVAPLQPKRHRKRKVVVDAGEASHLPKTLRKDHGAPSGVSMGGKSMYVIQRLLAGDVLNLEVGITALPTLPFVTSFVSAMPELDATTVPKETVAKPSMFTAGSSSAGGTKPTPNGFSDLTRNDFLVGGIRTVIDIDPDLQKVYVPRRNVTNGSCLDDDWVCREMVDEFAPPKFFASIRGIEHDQLFGEFNVGAARELTLGAEVRMCAEYNIKEKRRLKLVVADQAEALNVKAKEMEDLKAQLLLKEAKAAEAIRLHAKVFKFESIEKSFEDEIRSLKERNIALEEEKDVLDVRVTNLAATMKVREQEAADLDVVVTFVKLQNYRLIDQVHELETSSAGLREKVAAYENFVGQLEKFQDDKMKEERFYPHLLTTISGRRWLLTHGMELAIAKCLNSTEYLSALGAAIGKAVEKGMQDGLSADITYGVEGKTLTDVAAYNPLAEADYLAALHHLQSVNFSLITELKSNKDASVETIMNLLQL